MVAFIGRYPAPDGHEVLWNQEFFRGLLAGTCARRRTDFLCFAKESRQRKASRRQGRFAVPCAARVRWGLAELALRAQTTPALIPLPLRCSALPQRQKPEYPRFNEFDQHGVQLFVRAQCRKSGHRKPSKRPRPGGPTNTKDKGCAHPGRTLRGFPAVMRRRVAQATGGSGLALSERSEFSQTPPGASNAVCP